MIIDFHHQFPLEGYRRLTFMMLDRDIVAVSPSSTYRVLKGAGLLDCWKPKPSLKGTGFVQLSPHEHWHVDVSYINISGTFFYLWLAARRLLARNRTLGAALREHIRTA